MSKQTLTNTVAQTGNQKKKKALFIAIVCIVTAAIIAVSVTGVLTWWRAPDAKFPADLDNEQQPSSSDTIRNGDFEYVAEENGSFPKLAQNWRKYSYKEPTSSTTHGFTEITSNSETVMGVIDVSADNWSKTAADLAKYGLNDIENPGVYEGAEGDLVYMIHNLTDYTASIYSQSFTIPSDTSVKITLHVKTVDVTGAGVFAMVKSGTSALTESTSGVRYWYAHKGIEDAGITGTNDWQTIELYVFNQTASSKTSYVNVGLGNVYNGTSATGTVFIDDIVFETVTSNEYRLNHGDRLDHSKGDYYAYTIEKESQDNVTNTLSWDATATITNADYLAANNNIAPFDLQAGQNYSKIENDGTIKTPVKMTADGIAIGTPSFGMNYHVSVWLRVIAENGSKLPRANIYLVNAEDETDIKESFTNISTSEDLEKDTNNGFAQYHFYVKPSNLSEIKLKLIVTLGEKDGYTDQSAAAIPNGTVIATAPVIEEITQSDYSAASTGSTVKKVTLGASSSTSTITNGSFGSVANNSIPSADLHRPSGWTPVYAGSVILNHSGKDNITVPSGVHSVTSGTELGSQYAPVPDDNNGAVLKITNNEATSFGYLSDAISLNPHSVTLISVLARSLDAGAKPCVYLLDTAKDGTFNLQFTKASAAPADDAIFNDSPAQGKDGQSWTRYYFLVITGDSAKTLRLALFNGEIDATSETSDKLATGTVLFDQARTVSLGTYTRDNTQEDMFSKNDDGEWVLDKELAAEITYTATSGYDELEDILAALKDGEELKYDNVAVSDERITDVTEPEDEEENKDPVTPPSDDNPIDWALMISIITSAVLVAAIIIVVIMKYVFKPKK
ncbi:MAG: hypothetical protein NC350_04980 [Corallococcus sp.]|nr:hypothetical protein [Corallococcus sp.]